MNINKTEKLVCIGLLLALQIVLARFLSINTLVVRIGFSFVPLAVTAAAFGKTAAVTSAVLADLLGVMIFPTGPWFPGFTLSAALIGLTYGVFLYNRPRKLWRIVAAVLIVNIFISVILGTLWLTMITGKAYLVLLPTRVLQNLVLTPVKIITIWLVVYRLLPELNSRRRSAPMS